MTLKQGDRLLDGRPRLPECFIGFVQARGRQQKVDLAQLEALSHPNPEIVVECIVQLRIRPAYSFEGLASEERRRLAYEAFSFEPLAIEGRGWVAGNDFAVLVHPVAFTVDHRYIWSERKRAYSAGDRAGQISIVSVEEG